MRKTVEEWLNELPEHIKEKALVNLCEAEDYNKDNIEDILEEPEDSLWDAIAGSFIWTGTPEGNDFWKNVAEGNFEEV